jgi:tetratricopeptide (TPR) repeat protein/transcriptional regulator with XRE-family HTH domain
MYIRKILCYHFFRHIYHFFPGFIFLVSKDDKVTQIPETDPLPRLALTEARTDRRLSQKELADQLGTTHVNVSRWERGITKPNPYFRRKLCKLFGKTEEELDLIVVASARGTIPPLPTRPIPSDEPSHNGTTPVADDIHTQTAPQLPLTDPLPDLALYDPSIPLQAPIQLVGRDGDLERIKARLCAGGNVALTALNGLPGVGKTALSIALAHDPAIRDHFRDGILWAGLGPTPNVPGLLSRWGTLLGISQTEMAGLHGDEAWARAIRNAIGARTMLLVIDDAWKLEEALIFKVGGPNCVHLVTTRFRDIAAHVAVGGATELQELSADESMTLLQLLAPGAVEHEAQKAHTLVQAVGGLPLALTLMGNYLRKQAYSGQSRRITAALERLGKVEERLQISEPRGPVETHPSLPGETHLSLHSVIAVTDQLLPPEAQQALYALAVFPPKPNSFSEEAALAVIACDVEYLDLLIDSGLLEFTSSSGRYAIHQTISNYCQMHLQGSEPQERLIHYVIEFVEEHKKDYELLDQESDIVLRALDFAHELGMKEELVRAVIAFEPYMQARGSYEDAARHLQRALEAARELQNPDDIIHTFLYLGEIVHRQGNLTQAESHLQDGLKLARQVGNSEWISALLNELGGVAQRLGNLAQAEVYLQEGLDIARQIENKERICGILRGLGLVALYSGDYKQAEAYLQEGLALARQIDEHEQACQLLNNLGFAAGQQGNYEQAEIYYQEGLVLARQSGLRERICGLLANLGDVASEQGNYTQAEEYCREGLVVARQIEHREWMSVLLCTLGFITHKQGSYNEAETYLKEGLVLTREVGIPQMTAYTLYEFGCLYLSQSRIKDAEDSFTMMHTTAPENCQDIIALAQYGLARVAAAYCNDQEARQLGSASALALEKMGHRKAVEVRQWLNSITA